MSLKAKKRADTESNEGLQVVHTSQGHVEAEVIRSYLESNGIRSVFRGSGAQSILPQTTDGMGAIQICVLEKDAALAEELLKNLKLGRED